MAAPLAPDVPRLRVGRCGLVDAAGAPFLLRGASLFWSQMKPQFFTEETVGWLADDWRVNVVRAPLGVRHDGYLDHPKRELGKIRTVIEAAIDKGLYVIVDWHAHEPELEPAIVFFREISRTYPNAPNILYETWNEPASDYNWARDIKPYHLALIAEIRHRSPNAVIVAGTERWCQGVDVAARDPIAAPDVVYALHFYAASHGGRLRRRAMEALRSGAPLLVSEWGVCEANGDGRTSLRETRNWLHFLERHGVGHINWAVSDKVETASALYPGASPSGGWGIADLTPSGRFVRTMLRREALL
jgi:endoglucanase